LLPGMYSILRKMLVSGGVAARGDCLNLIR
jgi:hypothetical protein